MTAAAHPQPIVKRPWVEVLTVAVLFVLLGVVATWPMATDPAHLSVVKPTDNDYRFVNFVIFWGVHALTTDPLDLHHTNMFHPERFTLAYGDILLAHSLLMLPVIQVTNNQVLVYNLLLLVSMSIGGAGFYLLCREVTGSRVAALAGALVFVFNPVHFARHVQMQLFGDHWMPWFAWALLIWHKRAGEEDAPARVHWKWPFVVVAFFCLNALSGGQTALFGALIGGAMVTYYGIVDGLWRKPTYRRGLLVMGLACFVLLAPIFWPYAMVEREMLGPRTIMEQLVHGSAAPVELFSASSRLYRWIDAAFGWPSEVLGRQPRSYQFPGVVALALALFGLASGGLRRNRDLLFWLLLYLLAFWLALGPRAGLYLVIEKLPILRLLRVPSRIYLVAAFALSVLAAFGIAALHDRIPRRSLRAPLLAALALLFAVEAIHAPLTTHRFVPGPEPRHQFLAEQPGDFTVVEFPIDPDNYTLSTRQIFNSIHHWKRLLVGYSGFQTEANVERLKRLQARFPSDRCLDELEELGVRYVIVLEARLGHLHLQAVRTQPRLQPVRRFGEIVIYELVPRGG